MFLFLRLLLAHFIGDFPLQTSRVYSLKCGTGPGKSAHSLIVFLVSVLFTYPYWEYPSIWVYLVLAGLVHHASDAVKLAWNKTGNPKNFLWRYVGDQGVHVLTAAAIFLLPISRIKIPLEGPAFLAGFYNSDFCMLYASLLIAATYFGTYFIEAYKKSFRPERYIEILPASYKYQGILERLCLFHAAYWGGYIWIVAPLAMLPRLVMLRVWPKDFVSKSRPFSILDVVLSLALGLLPGLALKILQGLL